jgi:hypothetical protein
VDEENDMAIDELVEALDRRILEALEAKSTGESIAYLCEARAWLTNPAQSHGSHRPVS